MRAQEFVLDEACWAGYRKDGMKTMFGKRYPNCVKKKKKSESIDQQGVAEDMSRRGFLKGAGAMAAGISAAGGARANNQTDPNKLIAIVNINGESKEFNLTGRFKGDAKSQLHQAEEFITEFLEKRDINFSNLELRYQGTVLKTQNIGSVKEQQGVAEGARVARKAGQPADSKKHSDLYTDENPRGTITGLKFATAEDARASVTKIRSSGRSHAHKIQAAVAMEQRARAAGKAEAAAVYRRYINANKKSATAAGSTK